MSDDLFEKLGELRGRAAAAEASCDRIEADLRLLHAQLTARRLEVETVGKLLKDLHHAHQSTRSMIVNILSELEALVPSGAPK